MKFSILMTATIMPKLHASRIQRNRPEDRLADYRAALRFWSSLNDSRLLSIVFCENSGYPINKIKEEFSDTSIPIEFISFCEEQIPSDVHYGFSELGIIDHALDNSNHLKISDFFIKATGRLTFPKMLVLLNSLNVDFDAVVDHRRKYRREGGAKFKARTQLMLFKSSFYKKWLYGEKSEMLKLNFSHIEDFIGYKLNCEEISQKSKIIYRFPIECPPSGFAAFSGSSYDSFSIRAKNKARSICRYAFPFIWL